MPENLEATQAATAGTRPGGRSARVRADMVTATLAELTEKGYDQLTVEAICHRAGVHKATAYRRWGGVDGLIAGALALSADQPWPIPDTGNVDDDVELLAREVYITFTDRDLRTTPTALIGAALRSDLGAAALGAFFAARHQQAAEVVTRAIGRGQLPFGVDPVELVRATTAPLYHRLFITGEPLDERAAHRAAAAALLAARAGLFDAAVR
ncbi:TetR/AcrR family transcriptional regulator [Kitasatospora sp. MAP5-34]|uniref:TetR/AcrR family transcriptional regulator n=1 Tax=Kitasatospora sp. MAP5-34 TaxID=3035102 RepID=UPI002476479E|nr:TetR/AcrR family transcriptional regulator [Kitasatospora sp. MAP5-34]MDH6576242.1 AcrR family transcriptional regulator [Kitasatospora sp. MAP5-34]